MTKYHSVITILPLILT